MAVAVETVAVQALSISAGVPIPVAIPVFDEEDVEVAYGLEGELAVYNTDFTVTLLDPSNFNTFTLTPLTSLLNKINALIAADPLETNRIAIRRRLDYLTDMTPNAAHSTDRLSNEADRTVARMQQLAEDAKRAITTIKTFVGNAPQLKEITAGNTIILSVDGMFFEDGPTATEIANAQGYAEAAQEALADISELIGDVAVGDIAAAIHASPSKATPVVDDEFGIWDSVSTLFRKVTYGNLRTTLKAYFDTFYATIASIANMLETSDIGVSVQGYDADTVKSDTLANLTAGFTTTAVSDGTKSLGTYTPSPATGNWRSVTNNGAHTLAPPSASNDYTMIIDYTNGASAGVITTSGFTKVVGDAFTTTNGHKFRCFISKSALGTLLHVQAMQ